MAQQGGGDPDRIEGDGSVIKFLMLRAVKHAYSQFFAELRVVLRVVWLWAVALIAVTIAVANAWLLPFFYELRGNPYVFALFGIWFHQLPLWLLSIFVTSAVAVGWHRHILLGERIGPYYLGVTRPSFFYSLRVILCIIISLIVLIAIAVLLFFFFPSVEYIIFFGVYTPGPRWFYLLSQALILIAIGSTMVRFLLVFPAAAIADRRVGFASSWRLTRGNAFKLLIGMSLCVIPAQVFAFVLQLAIALLSGGGKILLTIKAVASVMLDMASALIAVGYMSHAYQYFVPPPDQSGGAQGQGGAQTATPPQQD